MALEIQQTFEAKNDTKEIVLTSKFKEFAQNVWASEKAIKVAEDGIKQQLGSMNKNPEQFKTNVTIIASIIKGRLGEEMTKLGDNTQVLNTISTKQSLSNRLWNFVSWLVESNQPTKMPQNTPWVTTGKKEVLNVWNITTKLPGLIENQRDQIRNMGG